VEVLSAGQKIQPDPQGKPETVTVVTLLLSPEDAQKLTLASSQATIQFVLRSGADKETPETSPVTLAELTGGIKKTEPEPVRRPRSAVATSKPAPPPPQFYTVEVIHGDKRSEATFE
jgi:pilus assembly protein CpaB